MRRMKTIAPKKVENTTIVVPCPVSRGIMPPPTRIIPNKKKAWKFSKPKQLDC